jgi:hypothetical protein
MNVLVHRRVGQFGGGAGIQADIKTITMLRRLCDDRHLRP